jgi:hypothetical protein
MLEQLISLLLILMAVGLVWILLKFVMKLTAKVFSCGFVVIVVLGGLYFLLQYLDMI